MEVREYLTFQCRVDPLIEVDREHIRFGQSGGVRMNFTVEVADLKGWAEQVGRAGTDLYAGHTYAQQNLAHAEFGKILELVVDEYSKLLPEVQSILQVDSERMDKTRLALIYAADEYRRTDRNFAGEIAKLDDSPLVVVDDQVADGFDDLGSGAAHLVAPTVSTSALPSISLGWPINKAVRLIVNIGGPDVEATITSWIAGDIKSAGTQVSAWEHLSACIEAVRKNLEHGQAQISKTWTGKASAAEAAYFGKWNTALDNQKTATAKMGHYLRDAVDQAVDLAQVVVDTVLLVSGFLIAAWTNAAIPVFGQIKLIQSVREAWTMFNAARKVLLVFWSLLKTIKDFIVLCHTVLTSESLPAAPAM
ncbi:WXG100 family type VII secretion target [Nocardia beijingensis]